MCVCVYTVLLRVDTLAESSSCPPGWEVVSVKCLQEGEKEEEAAAVCEQEQMVNGCPSSHPGQPQGDDSAGQTSRHTLSTPQLPPEASRESAHQPGAWGRGNWAWALARASKPHQLPLPV